MLFMERDDACWPPSEISHFHGLSHTLKRERDAAPEVDDGPSPLKRFDGQWQTFATKRPLEEGEQLWRDVKRPAAMPDVAPGPDAAVHHKRPWPPSDTPTEEFPETAFKWSRVDPQGLWDQSPAPPSRKRVVADIYNVPIDDMMDISALQSHTPPRPLSKGQRALVAIERATAGPAAPASPYTTFPRQLLTSGPLPAGLILGVPGALPRPPQHPKNMAIMLWQDPHKRDTLAPSVVDMFYGAPRVTVLEDSDDDDEVVEDDGECVPMQLGD